MIVGLLLIALFIFLGAQLYLVAMGFLRAVSSDSAAVSSPYADEATWTPPPYLPTEADYDNVSAVREYAEPTTTAEP